MKGNWNILENYSETLSKARKVNKKARREWTHIIWAGIRQYQGNSGNSYSSTAPPPCSHQGPTPALTAAPSLPSPPPRLCPHRRPVPALTAAPSLPSSLLLKPTHTTRSFTLTTNFYSPTPRYTHLQSVSDQRMGWCWQLTTPVYLYCQTMRFGLSVMR